MDKIQHKIYIDKIIKNIETARLKFHSHHIVKIVAISKYCSSQEIEKLYYIGQRAFGENRVQDLKEKSKELNELPVEWHFVGNLQKNKINNLLDINPSLFHSLDSIELAQELQKKLLTKNKTLNALLQINSANEDSKHGVLCEDAINIYETIKKICPNIKLKGVMSIGANSDDKELIKKSFMKTYNIYKQLDGASVCSMGMSGDYELAVECGSNLVRLGSIMFNKQKEN